MSPYRMSKIEESVRTALQFFDGINSKNITQLNEIIDDKCIFEDLWENTPKYNDKNKILEYFTQQFNGPTNSKIKVSEANNCGHKCIIKYEVTNNEENDNKKGQCIGLFEVYSGLIKSIRLYTKK